jgi:hypothetical protein
MRPDPLPGELQYDGTDSIESPEEDDYVSRDGITWYQYGKLVIIVAETEEPEARLRRHADSQNLWPEAWLISDHGNAHPFRYHI